MGHKSRKKYGKSAKGKQQHAVTRAVTRTGTAGETTSASPIYALVPDILAAIFAQALLEQAKVGYPKGWDRTVPMNVSAVCRHWRSIAIASPILWSTIKGFEKIGDSDSKGSSHEYPWKYFEIFLRRSGQAPLDISIKMRGPVLTSGNSLLSALHDNQTRLRSVDIRLFEVHFIRGLQADWSLPNLSIIEDLCIKWDSKTPIHLELKYAPFLRRLRLEGAISLRLCTDIIFPNLVNAELSSIYGLHHGFGIHNCITLLQASPSIEEFSASGITIADDRHHSNTKPDGKHICLSKLSSFSLTSLTPENIQLILGTLTLPGLKKLLVHVYAEGTATCGIHALLGRSDAMLETLDVCIPNIAELTQCLESSKDLRTLYLREGLSDSTTDAVGILFTHLLLLEHLDSSIQICPKLKKIIFDGCVLPAIEDDAVDIIHSWWNRQAGGTLEVVEFDFCTGGRSLALRLEERCEGLDIVVNNDSEDHYSDDDYMDYPADRLGDNYPDWFDFSAI